MAEKVKIKINIAGRFYPMSVNVNEEEIIRKAGNKINDMIRDFESTYDVRDKQDALAMCALQFLAKSIENDKSNFNEDEEAKNRLQRLIDDLEKHID